MEAGSATTDPSRINWRLWAVVPVLLLALAVGAVVTAGSSLVDLVGSNPPPADQFEYTDTVMLCQGERCVIEIEFHNAGKFMFHAHQSEFTELGWQGFFEVS